jgi:PAS domain S-box-containing protein
MNWILLSAVALLAIFAGMMWFLHREHEGVNQQKAEMTRLSLAANKTDNAVIVLNQEGAIDWVNEGFTRLSGHSLADVAGKPPATVLLGALQSSKNVQQIRNGLTSRKHFTVELLCSNKNGHRYWLSLSFTPVANAFGTATITDADQFDPNTGNNLRTFVTHTDYVWGVYYFPDKTRLLTSCDDKMLRIEELGVQHSLVIPFTPAFSLIESR